MNDIIQLGSGDLQIEVWTLGARLNGVWFQGSDTLTAGSDSEADALGAKKYNGAVVGPVANRIAQAQASIAGRDCTFERNENGITSLHSGADGVHAQYWDVLEQTSDSAILTLKLPDETGGFPGNRTLVAEYTVDGDALTVSFRATTDAPTWMNLALHPYWSLGVGRAGLTLQVDADHYTPVDGDKIPTGEIAAVDGTMFDLRDLTAPSPEIDHNFVLRPEGRIVLAADGFRMDVETDAPGVQIYSGKEIGIAIEPQHFPDAMHHAGFPSIELHPGSTYRQNSTYRFSAE
ncbi:MAG: aldose epimerase family protein [Pseudomonadota bacterium]